jgi:ascorbate-specific PTS system EIIC-type component UlaA
MIIGFFVKATPLNKIKNPEIRARLLPFAPLELKIEVLYPFRNNSTPVVVGILASFLAFLLLVYNSSLPQICSVPL